jgi:hypothetical protein
VLWETGVSGHRRASGIAAKPGTPSPVTATGAGGPFVVGSTLIEGNDPYERVRQDPSASGSF